MTPGITPSQTVGPYFTIGLTGSFGPELAARDAPGAIRIHGSLVDGAGEPVPDGLLEIWQADPSGRYDAEGFTGFGRCCTDAEGRFEFVTVKPGRVPGPDGRLQAPHVDVLVFARGLLKHLVTRVYFPDEEAANADDPVLDSIADAEARTSLVAAGEDEALRFDIHLQGEQQTTFFAL